MNFVVKAFFLATLLCSAEADVTSVNTKLKKGGLIRYHHVPGSECDVVFLIGVGTAMSVTDYERVSSEIVTDSSHVVVFVDQSPNFFVKTNGKKFAKVVNDVVENLGTIVPVCEGREPTFIIGGHSAGGMAAMNSIPTLTFSPSGYLGMDPFKINSKKDSINIPTMVWGFAETTCSVKINQAGKALYEISQEDERVFYRVDNKDVKHCSFTDKGCPIVCGQGPTAPAVRKSVGEATKKFVKAIADSNFDRSQFEIVTPEDLQMDLFVNSACVDCEPVTAQEPVKAQDPVAVPAL